MTEAVIVALLALAALAYVVRPLSSRRPTLAPVMDEAAADKRAALEAILDLEDERDAGKLSAEDFESLRAGYERRAVAAMRTGHLAEGDATDDATEAEIAALREQMRCPRCGALRMPDAACSRCGTS